MQDHPSHLDPSKLGTREYWDGYYQNDLDQHDEDDEPLDPSELESWFDDVDAPGKIMAYLTSDTFPRSPLALGGGQKECSVLDLGTGNGSMLFSLRTDGGFQGPMLGVDYSQQSIDLARRLAKQYELHEGSNRISFEKIDLIYENPTSEAWWPQGGFDLVLDKGTFDAISLSAETVEDDTRGEARICELYPRKVAEMVAPGGYLLVTSCNWTEKEIERWFLQGTGMAGKLDVFGTIQYPVYEFGGQKGQGVASVCFRRTQ